MDNKCTIKSLKDIVSQFVTERGWGKHHTPRNIADGIILESAELLAEFQWGNDFNNPLDDIRIKNELADVVIYALCMANVMEIDLSDAIMHKIGLNAEKYPLRASSCTIDFK